MNPWLVQFQNPLFGEISRNVRSWELNSTAVAIILATSSLVVLSIAGSILYNRKFRKVRRPEDDFAVKDPEVIQEILTTAMAQRARMEFSFEPIDAPHRSALCSLEAVGAQGLTIELPDYLKPKRDWKGRPVYLFFGLENEQKTRIFYTFATTIHDVFRRDSGRLYCITPFPDRLDLRQKRRHLRFEPPSQLIERLMVWNAVYSGGYVLETDVNRWGNPLFKVGPDGGDQVLLLNISACGMRLKIFQPVRRRTEFNPEKDRNLFLFVEVNDPETSARRKYWFSGALRNYAEDYATRDLEIGLNFMGLGEPDPERNKSLHWKKIDCDEGVLDLENWIVKRHMELYRKGVSG